MVAFTNLIHVKKMLILISPAKTLDFDTPAHIDEFSQADHLTDSTKLIKILRDKAPHEIASLMKISDKLANLNSERYHTWKRPFTAKNAKQAVLAFKGDVYTGLDAQSMTKAQLQWAQKHLRILSGLYGLLRPLDLMQAYRLEMGTSLENKAGKDLYAFWGDKITTSINEQLKTVRSKTLVNLASNEYFKSVNTQLIEADIIAPEFKDCKNGKYKIISFYAKKARGLMSAWIIENKIKKADQLMEFDIDGYYFDESLSTPNKPVFLRDEIK